VAGRKRRRGHNAQISKSEGKIRAHLWQCQLLSPLAPSTLGSRAHACPPSPVRAGTPYLAKTLNKALINHIRSCLPEIRRNLDKRLAEAEKELAVMGGDDTDNRRKQVREEGGREGGRG